MNKIDINIFSLIIFIVILITPLHAADVSEEELIEFRVTLYTEKERIPLDKLLTFDGNPYDNSELSGSYVLLNFWATWCPFCREEMPSKQRLYDNYTSGWFTLLTVSVGEEVNTITGYMNENGFIQPVILDPVNELKEIYAPRIPTSYVLSPDGYIIARINGYKEWDSERALRILRFLIPN